MSELANELIACPECGYGWNDFSKGFHYTHCSRVAGSPAAKPTKALSLNLDDSGQNFAGVATIRAAVFDVLDAGRNGDAWLFFRAPMQTYSEDRIVEDRGEFADQVIARIAELQNPPHEGVKLENLCETHKRQVLPRPSKMVCRMCEAGRKVKDGTS